MIEENNILRNWEILSRPYIRQRDIVKVLNTSKSTVSKKCRGLEKYPWGYDTRAVIKEFHLGDYMKWISKEIKKVDR